MSLEPFNDVIKLGEAFAIRFEDLSLQERSNDGTMAIVQTSGTLTISFLGQEDVQTINEEHLVVKKDGRWLICDP